MKTLRKIFLYNWHGFYKETIEINGSFLMTGENGSGKSTLLDALYFLLSGGDDSHFNKAANDDGQRTVESYMRGRTGKSPNPELRSDPNLISHIALEYYDDIDCVPLTIGVVLEIQENAGSIGRSFYHLKNTGISEDLFINRDDKGREVVLNFRAMKKRLDESVLNDLSSGKRSEIRRKMYAALSIDDKRYFSLLTSAISFKPIKDVGEFVYKFLMPERDVNIENIRKTIQSYRDLNTRINEDLRKKEHLENIIRTGKDLEASLGELLMNRALLHDMAREKAESDLQRYRSTIADSEIRLVEANRRKNVLNTDIDEITNTIRDLSNNETLRALNDLRINLNHEKGKLDELKKTESDFNRMLMKEDELCMKAGFNPGLGDRIKSRDFAELRKCAQQHCKRMMDLQEETQKEYFSIVEEEKRLADGLGKLDAEMQRLSKGLPDYPPQLESLRDSVRKSILENTGEDLELRPICERMDINDPSGVWRNAIEGTLGDRRFDLIIPHKAYPAALEAYLKEKGPRGIYRMGIVDEAGIMKTGSAGSGDGALLSSMLVSDDPLIDAHVKACLSGVVCSTEEDFLSLDNSVTSSCMRKVGDTVFHMSPREYEKPYIGNEAIRIQLENVKARIKELESQLDKTRVRKAEREDRKRILGESNIKVILNYDDVWSPKDNCQNHVDELVAREQELVAECGQVVHDIKGFQDKKNLKEKEREENDSLISELNGNIMVCRNNAASAEARVAEEKELFSGLISTDRDIRAFGAFKSGDRVGRDRVNEQIRSLEQKAGQEKERILREMTIYIERFDFDATADPDSLDAFETEYNTVVTRNLATYQTKLDAAKNEAKILFQNAYVADIRRHIKEERRNIAKLNKVLEDKPFGYDGEVYQFVISRSKDPAFAEYYDIFNSNEDFNVNDLFTEQLSEKNSTLLKDLFDMLTRETSNKDDEKAIREYTDYRRFMSYDIRIRNKEGEESYFSRINKEKSGGETQTPFYVIIAASFDQISQNNRLGSSGCVVMFDEAFNNMDEAHIDAMMRYFRQLSIQPVISVPTERCQTIFPYVDTAVGMVKVKDKIFPRPFIRETDR